MQSYFMYYSCVVIIFFDTGLCRGGSMVQGQVFLKKRRGGGGLALFLLFFFQGLSFLHLKITLPFVTLQNCHSKLSKMNLKTFHKLR